MNPGTLRRAARPDATPPRRDVIPMPDPPPLSPASRPSPAAPPSPAAAAHVPAPASSDAPSHVSAASTPPPSAPPAPPSPAPPAPAPPASVPAAKGPRWRRHLLTLLRVLVIAAGLGYIAWSVQWQDEMVEVPIRGAQVPGAEVPGAEVPGGETRLELREGMTTLVREADLLWLAGGLVLVGVVFPLQALRWYLLMRCRGLDVSFWSVQRLVMIGLFFNFCVPVGSNGGDVVKAYGAVKGFKSTGSTAIALVSVVLDRVGGMLGLIVLAAVMGPLMWFDPTGRKITLIAWAALGAVVLGGGVYLWPVTRKWLGLNLLTRVAAVKKLDAAVTGYRDHGATLGAAVGLSVPVHLAMCLATAMAGFAIGVETPLVMLVTALPVVFIVGALPLSYLGLGIMEVAAAELLIPGEETTISMNQIVAMLMAWRGYLLAYAVIGGAMMMGRGCS